MASKRFEQLQHRLAKKHVLASARWLQSRRPVPDPVGRGLFNLLTAPMEYRPSYNGEPFGELYIHWYYAKRHTDALSKCERFHLNMLQHFDVFNRVEKIHVCCAYSGAKTKAMDEATQILSQGKASVEFTVVLPKRSWEHDTFKRCVEDGVREGKYVYYVHFKGVTHIEDPILDVPYRNLGGQITPLNIMYWCYLMYWALFVEAPRGTKAIGPILYPKRPTLHYKDGKLVPKWAYIPKSHYTGSFQAFDGKNLYQRFQELGATLDKRLQDLWVGDPYAVEQFLTLCFHEDEIHSIGAVHDTAYAMYDSDFLPQHKAQFLALGRQYDIPEGCKNVCIANGTYKWIGGTDTFNWALGKALQDLGYTVYYYAPGMDGKGVTEKYLQEIGIMPYREGTPLVACFANQQSSKHFVDRCPVVQTCHSAFTDLELPIEGAVAYVSISEEIHDHLAVKGYHTVLIRNGCDLNRYRSQKPLRRVPKVLSICQGDDSLLEKACRELKYGFTSVPKGVGDRVWHIESLINQADLVVGIGRSLYDAMACGRACISWDNRRLNPCTGAGYITEGNWHVAAKRNFAGRGMPPISTVRQLVAELKKYRPEDGPVMRKLAEEELDMHKHAIEYLRLAGIAV